ncbi:hypothetical protein AURDEDRAFT_148237 [Auricularia subglabra TFB-10046 SS5]|nr:hypothetical protein AURDEDRAFT_148237 [Auricularia subglabra TFB-10046 SS5]
MSTGPSAPPPPPGGNGFRWGWGWHDPAATGVHPHHQHAYYRYGWYPRGPGRHRLFWFAVGAGTTYWLTHAHNCDHNKDFRGWRAQREAERAASQPQAPANAASPWGPWGGGDWRSSSSAEKTRSEATDTASAGAVGSDAELDLADGGRSAPPSSGEESAARVSHLGDAAASEAQADLKVVVPRFRGRLLFAGHGSFPGLMHVFNRVFFSVLRLYDYLMHLVATPFVRLLVPTQAILIDLNMNVVSESREQSALAIDAPDTPEEQASQD